MSSSARAILYTNNTIKYVQSENDNIVTVVGVSRCSKLSAYAQNFMFISNPDFAMKLSSAQVLKCIPVFFILSVSNLFRNM